MPRSLWSGSLSFGLVNVPVQLVSAARDLDYHFHQLHEKDKARIEQRRYCSEEDVEVVWEEVARSFELDGGKEVVVTDEELASVEPRKTRTIDIEAFVDLAEVDPIYFDHPYFLVPAGESEGTLRAYRLLVEAMGSAGARGARPLRDEDEGVPRGRAGARRRAGPDHDALPRRGPADRGPVPSGGKKPVQAGARRRRRDHRGALDRLGSRALHRLLPGAAAARSSSASARGQTIEAPTGGEGAAARPRPDGGARANARERPRGRGPAQRADGDGEDLAALSKEELDERATAAGRSAGRTKMSKEELVEALSGD